MFRKQWPILATSALVSLSAAAAPSWDLAGDFQPPSNPNGAWTYGELQEPSRTFSPLAWHAPTSSYGIAAVGQTFIYKNTGAADFGIAAGQVSLESDWGNAAVRWTAPAAGDYNFTIAIGGSTVSGPNGFGNNFAQYAGVRVDGADLLWDSFSNNVKLWNFMLTLAANATVDAFVVNPGFAAGGNTQTLFSVNASGNSVPEPATVLLVLLCLGVMAGVARRRGAEGAGQRT